jgi:DsbC/DsbD-like thiol-disulfide interchange protein
MFTVAIVAAWLAQEPQVATKKPIETAHLSVTVSASAAEVAAGGKVTLFLDVTPKPKMHVYAPGQEGYIAITLTLDADPGLVAAKAKYPAGEKYLMPALNETQIVYAKPFRIAQDVTVKSAAGAPKTIKGTLRYQACDDAICYLPKTIPVEWTINVR